MTSLIKTVLAAVDIHTQPKGLIKGKAREMLKKKYRMLKRYAQGSSIGLVVFETVKEYALQMTTEKAARETYKYGMYLMYYLPGPTLVLGGHSLFTLSTVKTLRSIGSTVYNVGNLIIKSELKIMDMTWLIPDFILFGEYVPTFNYVPLPLEKHPYIPNWVDIQNMNDFSQF